MYSKFLLEHQEVLKHSGLSIGEILTEKYRDYCYDPEMPIENDQERFHLAMLLENYNEYVSSMTETTRAAHVGDFAKYAFPMIRAIFTNLALMSLISSQPLLGPQGLIFFLDFIRGSKKGSAQKGGTVFSPLLRGPGDESYSSPNVPSEVIGTGDGTTTPIGTGSPKVKMLDYQPVSVGTLTITDGTQLLRDDGQGNLVGNGSGLIDYPTGAITSLTWTVAPAAGTPVEATYQYDMEANVAALIPSVDAVVHQIPVIARPRRLKTTFSLEAGFNLRNLHGLELNVELLSAAGALIRHEIDREGILMLQRSAQAGSLFYNTDLPSGVGYNEAILSFVQCLMTGNFLIQRATGRATANWVLCGFNIATLIASLPGFVPNTALPSGLMKGVVRLGSLRGMWDIWVDPWYDPDSWLMGYKGGSPLETGAVYSVYIPLYTTPLTTLEDHVARQGIGTHYALKMVNPYFYVTGEAAPGASIEARLQALGSTTATTGSISASGQLRKPFGSAADYLPAGKSGKGVFGMRLGM